MRVILLMVFFICRCSFAEGCHVVDDAGQRVQLNYPAKRIISLAPDLTELLFAAGAGSKVIGVMRGSDYPSIAKKIPIVANYNRIDIERILASSPDLIVAWDQSSFVLQLKKTGVPVYLSHQKKLTDIPETLHRLGCLAGTEKIASRAANNFLQQYTALQKKYSDKKKLSVFYQVWPKPLITLTKQSWINDVIVLCGGRNIFADVAGVSPVINLEAVILANPEVIIGTDLKKTWQAWPKLTAVRYNQLISINPDLLERASPRILIGVEQVCRELDVMRRKF